MKRTAMRYAVAHHALLLLVVLASGCVYALHKARRPTLVKLKVQTSHPRAYSVRVGVKDPLDFFSEYFVAPDGRVEFTVPSFRNGCSEYLFGVIRTRNGSAEIVPVVQLCCNERVVRKISLSQIAKLPTDEAGYSILPVADCSTTNTPNFIQVTSPPPKPPTNTLSNVIAPGVAICVCVREDRSLNRRYLVPLSGVIDFVGVGKIPVVGLTTEEVARKIKDGLERDFFEKATVKVTIVSGESLRQVFLVDENGSIHTLPNNESVTPAMVQMLHIHRIISFNGAGQRFDTVLGGAGERDLAPYTFVTGCPCD